MDINSKKSNRHGGMEAVHYFFYQQWTIKTPVIFKKQRSIKKLYGNIFRNATKSTTDQIDNVG